MSEIRLAHWDHPTLTIIGINVLIFTKIQQHLGKNRFVFGNACFLFMKFLALIKSGYCKPEKHKALDIFFRSW